MSHKSDRQRGKPEEDEVDEEARVEPIDSCSRGKKYAVIGYRLGSSFFLAFKRTREEADSCRDRLLSQLEGYERIVVEYVKTRV